MLSTENMGGVVVTPDQLSEMQVGDYILHARDGMLNKVEVEKIRMPLDPQAHYQGLNLVLAPDNTIYAVQQTIISKSADGGRTWEHLKRNPSAFGFNGWLLQANRHGQLINVSQQGEESPITVWLSDDEGQTMLATMPLATVVLAHAFTPDERLTPLRGLGVTVGFGGIVVLVGPDALAGLGREVVSQFAIVGAACCYAVTTVFVRRSRLIELPPAVNSAGVLVTAAIVALPLALIVDRPWELPAPSTGSLLALVVLALFCTSAAFLILFRLLAATGATFVSLLNYLAPVFGVTWGALLLGEPLHLDALGAFALILLGLVLAHTKGPQ